MDAKRCAGPSHSGSADLTYVPLLALAQQYYVVEALDAVQAEDKEGETPLSVAATKGLRQLLVDVATGKTSADELMEDA